MPITTVTPIVVPIDIQITPDDNITVMWLTNDVDQLLLSSSLSTEWL